MDKKIFIFAAVVAVFAAVIIYNLYSIVAIQQTAVESVLPGRVKKIVENQMLADQKQAIAPIADFAPPLDRAAERITKKTFGTFVTPQNSPVKPEKFRGYHTGTDFEIFPEELNADVAVKAVCDGKVAQKRYASGYGGVLVENCERDGQPITVVYGHLKLAGISKKIGDSLSQGEEIGILGKAYSQETSGERKHLHLGAHKGSSVNILGYVQKESDLSAWLDPCSLDSICQ